MSKIGPKEAQRRAMREDSGRAKPRREVMPHLPATARTRTGLHKASAPAVKAKGADPASRARVVASAIGQAAGLPPDVDIVLYHKMLKERERRNGYSAKSMRKIRARRKAEKLAAATIDS